MLQVGVDCEEISRFRRLPYGRNEKFYKRIFTPYEIEYCTSCRDPYPRFTARFTAKEAVIKALNNIAKPCYADIEIQKDRNDQPRIHIDRKKFKAIMPLSMSLSLAHSNHHAIAFTIITDRKNDRNKIRETLKKSVSYIKRNIRG